MVTIRTMVSTGMAAASLALAGCVGYDGGSDNASMQARSLGLTADEEETIRAALAQRALTADEIAKLERDLGDGNGLPGEWRTQSALTNAARAFKGVADYGSCAGDINCSSLHCSQVNICIPERTLKSAGASASFAFDCRSSRLDPSSDTKKCAAIRTVDRNGAKDQGETDVDCGGPNSPYACPVGASCSGDEDCVVGSCSAGTGASTKTCTLARPKLVDIGRFWLSTVAPPSGAPYSQVIRVSADRAKAPQIDAVTRAPTLRDRNGAPIEAEQTFTYQHDTCVAHLLAQGCSPLAIELRTRAESYELIICPVKDLRSYGPSPSVFGVNTGARAGIAIATREKQLNWETVRRASSLKDDPFLCNHSYTRGTRVLSHEASKNTPQNRETVVISDERTDGGGWDQTTFWTGPTITKNDNLYSVKQDRYYAGVREWGKQLEYFLLGGAACSAQRVRIGETAISSFRARAGFSHAAFCSRFAPYAVPGAPATTTTASTFAPFTQDEWSFIKENVPWWNDYDIYSIDPEGNPYAPVNMNMQYGWDSMHPGMSFGVYAASFGGALVPTSTNYSFNGGSVAVWGTSNTAPFQWNVRR